MRPDWKKISESKGQLKDHKKYLTFNGYSGNIGIGTAYVDENGEIEKIGTVVPRVSKEFDEIYWAELPDPPYPEKKEIELKKKRIKQQIENLQAKLKEIEGME